MKSYVQWRTSYSVGEPSIDAQHKQILSIINDMYAARDAGKEHLERKRLLERLIQYTMDHFQHEEQIMLACDYPDLANHKKEHDRMRRRTLDLRDNLDLVTAHDLLCVLKDWWTNHIQAEDQCYVPFVSGTVRSSRSTAAPTQPVGPVDWRGQATTY